MTGVKGTLIFQPDFKAVLYLCNGISCFFVSAHSPFVMQKIFHFGGSRYTGSSHTFFFPTPYQFTAAVALDRFLRRAALCGKSFRSP